MYISDVETKIVLSFLAFCKKKPDAEKQVGSLLSTSVIQDNR